MATRSRTSAAIERPQQLDDLLGVLPLLARPGAVGEPVRGFADPHVRLALPPQFDGLGDYLGVDGPKVSGDSVLGLPGFGALLLAGGACPPEDCGGPWGYGDFLDAIQNPRHERYKELLEWVGGEFDPEAFDIEAVNEELH